MNAVGIDVSKGKSMVAIIVLKSFSILQIAHCASSVTIKNT